MYAVMRRYALAPQHYSEVISRKVEGSVPVAREIPGFVSYTLVGSGKDAFVAVALYDGKSGADESTRRAADWVKEHLASVLPTPPDVLTGEVRLRLAVRDPLFGVLRQYRTDVKNVAILVERAKQEFLPLVSGLPDFATYALVDAGGGNLVTLSGFRTAKGASESSRVAADWVKNRLTSLVPEPPQVTYGEVRYRLTVK